MDGRRVVLITGCSSGIGRATALLLAEQGWRVFASARRLESVSELASDQITPLQLDVTDEASMVAAIEQVLGQAGRIDALVNNAGYAQAGPLEEATPEEIRREFETNTLGPLRLAQLVLPAMRAQGSGRIVNVSTVGGRVAHAFAGLYSGSKFALEAASDALRMETRPFGVDVVVVEPSGVRTSFNSTLADRARRFAEDATSPYHPYFARTERFIERASVRSSPPEMVAAAIDHALTTDHPRARYPGTPDARLILAIVPRLPDRLLDAVWGSLLGLRSVAGRREPIATPETPVAIITGCSSGIGRATALLLAERGWRVFASARRLESASELASDQITPLQLDVTDEASMVAAIEQVLGQAGRIDALVNNAGYAQAGPLEEATPEEIRRQFETNTFGPLRLAQLVLPTMRAQSSGRIVNVSSINGRVAIPFIGLYCASKFALEAISDALRLESQPFGVRTIVIEPGSTKTNFTEASACSSQRFATDTSSPYHRYFEAFSRLIERTAWSSPPETVAKAIHRALTADRPHARYRATPQARLMLALAPLLPDKLRDALWSRMLGLHEDIAQRATAEVSR